MPNKNDLKYLNTKLEDFFNKNQKVGFLTFQATTAQGNIPVENVKITINLPLGNDYHISKILYSDKSGKTKPFPLPAPSNELSNSPGDIKPYSEYNVSATADGYSTIELFNIPVFEGINSIQPINLLPVLGGKNKEIFEEEPQDL